MAKMICLNAFLGWGGGLVGLCAFSKKKNELFKS